MSKTNTLNSHCGERRSHRADKMSGSGKDWMRLCCRGVSKKFMKHFSNKKRRAFLNNEEFFDKI